MICWVTKACYKTACVFLVLCENSIYMYERVPVCAIFIVKSGGIYSKVGCR